MMMRLLVVVVFFVGLLVASAKAFIVGPESSSWQLRPVQHQRQYASKPSLSSSSSSLRMSEPSDTTPDDDDDDEFVITIEGEEYEGTPEEALVSNVMDLMPDTIGVEVSAETRAAINEALYKLEAMNPTKVSPTMSPLLNGVWELRYAGGFASEWSLPSPTRQLALFLYSGGYSPGLFALQLAQKLPSALVTTGDLEIAIAREQPRVEATIGVKLLGGAENKIQVKARLEVQSDVRLQETYESASVFDNAVDIPAQLQYSRDLYVTYLDDDLLVVRDASGIPEVLVRKEKTFTRNWGFEPSEAEDMVPPGEK